MTRARFVSFSAAAVSLLAAAPSAHAADPAADHGQKLFMAYNCYECHGDVGQGGAGPTIAPPRLPPRSTFMAFVRAPSPPAMPPYTTKVLSDEDLGAIYAYLNSLPPPAAALPPDLARLKQAKAK